MKSDGRVPVHWYLLVMVVVVPCVFTAVGIALSLRASNSAIEAERESRRASELALCQVLSLLDDTYTQTPPTTVTGQRLAVAVRNLMRTNGCP